MNERVSIWDDDTQTKISNIKVAGVVTIEVALLNVGERKGRHAVVLMFGSIIKPLSYKNISTIMFLHPEVATLGRSGKNARRRVSHTSS